MPSCAKTLCCRLMPATVSSTSVRMVPCSRCVRAALSDDAAEDLPVESLGDRLAFLLGIADALQRREELLFRVHHLDQHAELAETRHDLLGLSLTHEAVLDEDGLQAVSERAMAEHRDRGRIDPSRQGIDCNSVSHRVADLLYFLLDEFAGVQLLGGNLLDHGVISFC